MNHTAPFKKRARWFLITLGVLVLITALVWFAQTVIAHRSANFTPDYPMEELAPLLAQSALTEEDYDTLFLQTGLGRPAVDRLLAYGDWGKEQMNEIQRQFFSNPDVTCEPLFGPFVKEDHLSPAENGDAVWAPWMPDLQDGDVLLTFSTHSLGWRHGHAGLVIDAAKEQSLEAVVIGSDSQLMPTWHWRAYTNYMVLRLKDMTPELQRDLTQWSLEHLNGVPYHLTSGFLGPKAPGPDAPYFGVQCSYLVWYALQQFGFDADSDGGRLVTVYDLSKSPLLEVIQVYGLDPRDWM